MVQSDLQRLRVQARAAEAISAGDTVNTQIRRYQNWGLAPFAAVMGSVYPAAYCRGPREAFHPGDGFGRFTAWLGNNSSQNKQKRLVSVRTGGYRNTRSYHESSGRTCSLRASLVPSPDSVSPRPTQLPPQELHTRMSASGSAHLDRTALRLEVLPVLRQGLFKPLQDQGAEAIDEVRAGEGRGAAASI